MITFYLPEFTAMMHYLNFLGKVGFPLPRMVHSKGYHLVTIIPNAFRQPQLALTLQGHNLMGNRRSFPGYSLNTWWSLGFGGQRGVCYGNLLTHRG